MGPTMSPQAEVNVSLIILISWFLIYSFAHVSFLRPCLQTDSCTADLALFLRTLFSIVSAIHVAIASNLSASPAFFVRLSSVLLRHLASFLSCFPVSLLCELSDVIQRAV